MEFRCCWFHPLLFKLSCFAFDIGTGAQCNTAIGGGEISSTRYLPLPSPWNKYSSAITWWWYQSWFLRLGNYARLEINSSSRSNKKVTLLQHAGCNLILDIICIIKCNRQLRGNNCPLTFNNSNTKGVLLSAMAKELLIREQCRRGGLRQHFLLF